jgi:hypothetical protein
MVSYDSIPWWRLHNSWTEVKAAQQALAADRFAHEIRAILAGGFGQHVISIYDCGG